MRGPTPKQKRRIERLASEFGENWENDYTNKQIVRKPRSVTKAVWETIIGKKFSVFAMYWWVKKDRLNNRTSRKFDIPLRHDNTPIKGLPIKYELQGGWTLKDEDLRFLKDGPLISEGNPDEVLVGFDQGTSKITRLAREWAPLITIVLGIATFALRLAGVL